MFVGKRPSRRRPGPSRKAAGSPCALGALARGSASGSKSRLPGRTVPKRPPSELPDQTDQILLRPAPSLKGGASPYGNRGGRPSCRPMSRGRSPGPRSRRSEVDGRTQDPGPPQPAPSPRTGASRCVVLPHERSSGSRSVTTFGTRDRRARRTPPFRRLRASTTSTWPDGRREAVCPERAEFMDPVAEKVPVAGS